MQAGVQFLVAEEHRGVGLPEHARLGLGRASGTGRQQRRRLPAVSPPQQGLAAEPQAIATRFRARRDPIAEIVLVAAFAAASERLVRPWTFPSSTAAGCRGSGGVLPSGLRSRQAGTASPADSAFFLLDCSIGRRVNDLPRDRLGKRRRIVARSRPCGSAVRRPDNSGRRRVVAAWRVLPGIVLGSGRGRENDSARHQGQSEPQAGQPPDGLPAWNRIFGK